MALYIIIAILGFGILIAVHEAGHFVAAKLLGVRVNEFAIGMGPRLLSGRKGETLYTWRLLPIGGFCAMEGEDEDSDDPRAFPNKAGWKKFIILVAGSAMNFVAGLLILLLVLSQNSVVNQPVIQGFAEGFPLAGEAGLLPGDRILTIDGARVFVYSDVVMLLERSTGGTTDLVIERGGQTITRKDLPLTPRTYVTNGEARLRYGIDFTAVPATPLLTLRETFFHAVDFVRMVWMGLRDLLTGAAGLRELSGPIGIIDSVGQMGAGADSISEGVQTVCFFLSLIAVNLAVMNLLPIPALDGGRILFVLIGGVFTLFTRRRLNPKFEGYINTAGFVCLLGLMAVVAVSDVLKMIR